MMIMKSIEVVYDPSGSRLVLTEIKYKCAIPTELIKIIKLLINLN